MSMNQLNTRRYMTVFCSEMDDCSRNNCKFSHSWQDKKRIVCFNLDRCENADCVFYHEKKHDEWVEKNRSEWARLKKNRSTFKAAEEKVVEDKVVKNTEDTSEYTLTLPERPTIINKKVSVVNNQIIASFEIVMGPVKSENTEDKSWVKVVSKKRQ